MIYSENILICIAIPILITMIYIKGSAKRYAFYFVLGMGICLVAAYISGYINVINGKGADWTSVYVAPVIEETLKLLPLLIYMILYEPEEDLIFSSGVALAAGFATFENCCFILSSGAEHLSYVLIRGMAAGVMHIVSIMALCLGLVLVRRLVSFSIPGIVGALSFSMTFHSLYNLLVSAQGISAVFGYVVPVISALLLYFPYKRLLRPPEAEPESEDAPAEADT